MNTKLSKYALDNFVAPRISELTKISAGEINGECGWLNIFILNFTFRIKIEEPFRKYTFNFLLREFAKICRNDPCHRGSGKKYKKCYLGNMNK